MADPRDPRPLIGEPLALDLLNTRWHPVAPRDLLTDLDGYRIWLSSAGLADRCPADQASLDAVLIARDAVAGLVLAAEQGRTASPDALNGVLAHGRIRHTLGADGPTEQVEPDGAHWLAAWLAADNYLDLLRQGPQRIKSCAHEACILHFFDTSQNGRRRWCSMASCGNRAKAARHYRRTAGAESGHGTA